MYIDWKFDNIGIGSDGNYKLFDFDASGITNKNNTKWLENYDPPQIFYNYRIATVENGRKMPLEIDDFCFEYNIK